MVFVETLPEVTLADDRKEVNVKEVPVVAVVLMTFVAVRVLTNREETYTEFWAAKIRFPLLPVMYAAAPVLPAVVWLPYT